MCVSIVTGVMAKLGMFVSWLPKNHEFRLQFVRASSPEKKRGRSKAWFSPKGGQEFQINQLAVRAFNESTGRVPIAR
jgi:hypothetical protein